MSLTPEDIQDLFRETDRRLAELSQTVQQTELQLSQLGHKSDRIDAQLAALSQNVDRLSQNGDRIDAQLAALSQSDDRRSQNGDRIDAQQQEMGRRFDQLMQEMSGLNSRWGRFVENLVEPSLVKLLQERGIAVTEVHSRVKSKRPGAAMEIDLLAVDGDVVVAVEVKSRLGVSDVREFVDRLGRFKQVFPRYVDCAIYGAVAGIEIDQGADRFAAGEGLFVICQAGELVEIANAADFVPIAY